MSMENVDSEENQLINLNFGDDSSGYQSDTAPSNFFKDLFDVFDSEKLGYITVENFVNISKQNMSDTFTTDENEIKEYIKILDPYDAGKIDYNQFVQGLTKLMADKNEILKGEPDLVSNIPSNFEYLNDNNGSILNDQLNNHSNSDTNFSSPKNENVFEEIFQNFNTSENTFENNTRNYNDERNDHENFDLVDLNSDFFGLDSDVLNNHRKSLFNKRNAFLDSKKRLSLQVDYPSYDRNVEEKQNDSNFEIMIETLEIKNKELTEQNENMKAQLNDQLDKYKILSNENERFIEKNRELEELTLEIERKFLHEIDEEKARHVENINKINFSQIEERENFAKQMKEMEIELKNSKNLIKKYLDEIDELNKNLAFKDSLLIKEETKYNLAREDQKSLDGQIEKLKEVVESQKENYEEKIEEFKNQLDETQMLLKEYEYANRRKNTVYDDSYYLNQIKNLETENTNLKSECEKLKANLETLNVQLQNNYLDDGRILINLTQNTNESLASEINNFTKEEIMEKLTLEQKISARLKEYVDELMSKILENNPEILEVNAKSTKRK